MSVVTTKTATLFVSDGGRLKPFQSWPDVPRDVRKQLRTPTAGRAKIKIIIANRHGKAVISRALDEQSRTRVKRPARSPHTNPPVSRRWIFELAACGLLGLFGWLVFLWL
jgi:hypothetical protein